MLSKASLFLFAFGLVAVVSAFDPASVDWCAAAEEYCYPGEVHIACPSTGDLGYGTNCKDVKVVPMDESLKNFILRQHNEYRQHIANGCNGKFPSAKKMGIMTWDDSLQYTAEKHVEHCQFAHDCHSSEEFPYSGQNLYYMGTYGTAPNVTKGVEMGMKAWFDEWKLANPSIVQSINNGPSSAYHFSTMLNDRNNKVGCGVIQYKLLNGGWEFDAVMITCNYEYTNMWNEPMYTEGAPCSDCTCSIKYPALCSTGCGDY